MRNFAWLASQLVREFGELLACISAADPQGTSLGRTLPALELKVLSGLSKRRYAQEVIAAAHGITAEGLRRRRIRLEEQRQERTLVDKVVDVFRVADQPLERLQVARSIYAAGDKRHEQVFSVLRHLTRSGLLSVTKSGRKILYEQGPHFSAAAATQYDAMLVCARVGPIALGELAQVLEIENEACRSLVEPLLEEGLLNGNGDLLSAPEAEVLFDSPSGFAAAVYDHMRAVCQALARKVDGGRRQARPDDVEGGSTFSILVPRDHPLRDEILGFLAETNARVRSWREQTREFEPSEHPGRPYDEVTLYFGQMVDQHAVRRTQTE